MPNAVNLDSRKFLSALNSSAQAKVAFFEERVQTMGQAAGKSWQLVALRDQDLFFEDVDTNKYYVADHGTDHGKVTIANIRQVNIYEKEKQIVFEDACLKLVNAIEENDQRGMQAMFNTMKKHRFSGRSIPFSGVVQCRDGVTRHITVATENAIEEDIRPKLVKAIVESLRDRVIVENGEIVSASFNDGSPLRLPVTKWAARKLVAKRMRDTAANAYWSEGFQKRMLQTSSYIAEGKIEEAVKFISPFLAEMEEFTLLNRNQIRTLVENSLATQAVFNQQLCEDTATLMYRTNLRINRNKIVDEWKNIARSAEHPVLAENVQILSESKNFESAYDRFLELIFEAISNREVAAEALATTLGVLKDKTPRIKESHDLSSKLDGLIARLKDPNFDDAAIYEAEDLIATIQEELAANETLNSFDQIPGQGGGLADELTADLNQQQPQTPPQGQGAPVININSPLIQVGGTSGGAGSDDLGLEDDLGEFGGESEAGGPEGGGEDLGVGMDAGEEDELANMLGGPGGAGALESRKRGTAIKESRPVHYEMKDEQDDDLAAGPDDRKETEDIEESNDPYAFKDVRVAEGSLLASYGAPVITDEHDLHKVVQIMQKLAEEHNLTGKKLEESLESMAKAGIRAIGLRIPEGRLNKAVEQAIAVFSEGEGPFPGAAPLFGSKDDGESESTENDDADDSEPEESESDDSDDSDDSGKPWEKDDEGVAEDQAHGPRIPGRGYARASYQNTSKKTHSESKIVWGEKQNDAIAGKYNGVGFILDHGGPESNMPVVILSEDGAVEIPVPKKLHDNALAAAGIMEGDARGFVKWLSGSIEQLRPISDEEDQALAEAMAKITTTPDGQITVEVSDDIEVNDLDDAGVPDDADDMAPVDSVDVPEPEETAELGDDEMPDFEGDEEEVIMEPGTEEMGEEGEEPVAPAPVGKGPAAQGVEGLEDEEEEEPAFEDKDITSPQSSKYTKHVKDNKREMPEPKLPSKTDDSLEEVGPELKKDDGSGTKPPTARKASNE